MSPAKRFRVGHKSFRVRSSDPADQYLKLIHGRFEPNLQTLCRRVLSDGAVAMDVGANIGATALIMSAFVGHGRVIAVEPGPKAFAALCDNVQTNGAGAVECHNYALSSTSGRVAFREDSSFGHLVDDPSQATGDPAGVAVRTLDDLVESLQLQRLDFLKIDTEGFEPQVLAGAQATLARFRPIVYLELNAWTLLAHGANNPLEFLRALTEQYPHMARVKRFTNRLILETVEGPAEHRANVLAHDNLVYFNAFNDLVLFPDEAAAARFADIMAPRSEVVRAGLIRRALRRIGRLLPLA